MSEEQAADDAAEKQPQGDEEAAEAESYAPEAMDDAPAPPPADVNLELVLNVEVSLALNVGNTTLTIRELVSLAEGSVVALDRAATEPLDVLVNGTLVAHGEIVVVDGRFGVRLTDVISPAERIERLA